VEARRRERAERRATETGAALAARERERNALSIENAALREEAAAAEAALAVQHAAQSEAAEMVGNLGGATVLYVGGRPRQAAQMKLLVERASGQLLHHDGGIEDHPDLLAGLVSRAAVAFFPVDCVSHAAMDSVKRLCRQAGKPFVPLRSSG